MILARMSTVCGLPWIGFVLAGVTLYLFGVWVGWYGRGGRR